MHHESAALGEHFFGVLRALSVKYVGLVVEGVDQLFDNADRALIVPDQLAVGERRGLERDDIVSCINPIAFEAVLILGVPAAVAVEILVDSLRDLEELIERPLSVVDELIEIGGLVFGG